MFRMVKLFPLLFMFGRLQAAVIDTNDPGTIAAFQSGATVVNFESVTGLTPQAITAYTAGDAVSAGSFLFDQISGVQFSVGGAPGTNMPALYQLSGAIQGDATSPSTVLGPVDFDFTTKFSSGALIEIFFPVKVSKVGFWLNPSLGNVNIIAADTNFAFSQETETTLETGNVTAGNFVGIVRPTADIGGFKIIGLGATGFTIDDFTYGGASVSPVPEPASLMLAGAGLLVAAFLRWRRHYAR
ncbi:MAG TPA: PEP-CTERM sorting domain-containing protein [Bryobacteraceae bacterium]|nr:PEP-CTERM sorting domain-containing protein [Bryobacteraceae bacterium]